MQRFKLYVGILALALVSKWALATDWTNILPTRADVRSMLKDAAIDESSQIPRLTKQQLLGRDLFFDPTLSVNGTMSCATCHDPNHGYASNGLPKGLDGKLLTRKSPSLLNCHRSRLFFWDGHSDSLEDQVKGPLLHPNEMGNVSMVSVVERL